MLETVDGLQVPEIPLSDVVGSTGAVEPLQIVVGMENDVTPELVMVTFSVKVDAQEVDGVKT